MGDKLPNELADEPVMVLVEGDVVQVSKRQDGWAFGTKLYIADDKIARELLRVTLAALGRDSDSSDEDDASVFTDTGWFQEDATRTPTVEDLDVLHSKVGDTDALAAPEYWEAVADATVAQQHELFEGDPEYQMVVQSFLSTLQPPKFNKKVKVKKVQRIQNLAMWQGYVVKRQTICYRDCPGGASDPAAMSKAIDRFERCWLWHGSNAEVVDKILQQGFNRSFCGKNATAYGKGVYFARDAR